MPMIVTFSCYNDGFCVTMGRFYPSFLDIAFKITLLGENVIMMHLADENIPYQVVKYNAWMTSSLSRYSSLVIALEI